MNLITQSERKFDETGIEGVTLCVLWDNKSNGGAALVKMKNGSTFPLHNHPGWEQLYVLSGEVAIAEVSVTNGDYLFTDAGEIHSVIAKEDSDILVFSEKGIEIVE